MSKPTINTRVMRPARLDSGPTKPLTIPWRLLMTFIPAFSPKTTEANTSSPMTEVNNVKRPPMVPFKVSVILSMILVC